MFTVQRAQLAQQPRLRAARSFTRLRLRSYQRACTTLHRIVVSHSATARWEAIIDPRGERWTRLAASEKRSRPGIICLFFISSLFAISARERRARHHARCCCCCCCWSVITRSAFPSGGKHFRTARYANARRRGRMRSSLKVGSNDSTNASASTLCDIPARDPLEENAFRKLR